MKKTVIALLCAALLLSLCSCAGVELPKPSPAPEAEPTAVPTQAPEIIPSGTQEPVPQAAEFEPGCRVIVNVNNTELTEYAPDGSGRLILTFSYETPIVFIEGNDAAAAKINDTLSMHDERFYSGYNTDDAYEEGFNAMLEAAIDNFTYAYNTGKDIKLDFSKIRKVSIERIDSVLSVVYTETTYSGDLNESSSIYAMNFDLSTGELITLDKLVSDMDAFKQLVSDFILEWMPDKAAEIGVEEYTEAVIGLIREGSWYFADNGLCFVSDQHEIAGALSEQIHYFCLFNSYLEGNIASEYLPKVGAVGGSFEAFSQQSYAAGMDIIDRVVIDEGGETVYIAVSGTKSAIKLYDVEFANDAFFVTGLRWACSYVTDGVIQLVCDIPSGMPKLAISDTFSGEMNMNILFLTSDGFGGVSLVDDSIRAVG